MIRSFTFAAQVWIYPGAGGWHFVSVPKDVSQTIKTKYSTTKKAWGSIAVEAVIAEISWKTSIFPDSKSGLYLLPLKAQIRKRLGIAADDKIKLTISIA